MNNLYPEIRPVREYTLAVDALHGVHVEESGHPQGLPLLILHDGPGAGLDALHRRLMDAERFRIIQFDQRGCGRSTPLAETRQNTTADLVSDIEALRQHLGLDRWMLFGHGWGATLALAYATQFPEHVMGLVLSSVFLGAPDDIDWAFAAGAAAFFPDAWKEFAGGVSERTTEEVLTYYGERLGSSNELQQIQAARQWARWETTVQVVHPSQDLAERLQHPHVAISLARLSCHYLRNACFLEQPLLSRLDRLHDVRAILVHGRFNVVTPLRAAWTLHRQWPASELYIIRDASHSLHDPAMTDAVMRAIATLGDRLSGQDTPRAE